MLAFAVNGALTALLGRWLLGGVIGLEGSLWAGPWGYRLTYLALVPPLYWTLLPATGALFGKGAYFRKRVRRIWSAPLLLRRLRE